MSHTKSTDDPIWTRIRAEAHGAVEAEPLIGGVAYDNILHHGDLESALAYRMAMKLAGTEISVQLLRGLCDEVYAQSPIVRSGARADLQAVLERDPACHRLIEPLLYFKGFQAVQAHRVAHFLWHQGRKDMAYLLQMRSSQEFGVDIHPAAEIGGGLMIDHAHSVVIGETARVGRNVSILHAVTLGGTGKAEQDRHPKIGDNVLIGAGAKVLGNITIGACSRIAAGSVVLDHVPPNVTVAGVPAKVVGEAGCPEPARSMNQMLGD